MTQNLGLIWIYGEFGVDRARRILPPEHVIEAERPDPVTGAVELLVRGPLLPMYAAATQIPRVMVLITMYQVEPKGIRLMGAFKTAPTPSGAVFLSAEWVIGEWATIDAYHADLTPPLRAKAREVVRNDTYARMAIADVTANCTGPVTKPQTNEHPGPTSERDDAHPEPKPPAPQGDWKSRIRTR